jgi:hypothetical protein
MGRNTTGIQFIAGLHGDERAPVSALKKAKVPFLLGNPAAYRMNVRFLERDLNSSFGRKGGDKEAKRARELLKKISDNMCVVDFHTTSAKTPPFSIVVDKKLLPLAARTGIKRVVYMRHNIKGGRALINVRRGISVEAGTHATKQSHEITLRVVKNVASEKYWSIDLYEVYGVIKRSGHYKNFVKHKDDFIPILSGEKSYRHHGLKARYMGRISASALRAV